MQFLISVYQTRGAVLPNLGKLGVDGAELYLDTHFRYTGQAIYHLSNKF
jgi:hypothetical protein